MLSCCVRVSAVFIIQHFFLGRCVSGVGLQTSRFGGRREHENTGRTPTCRKTGFNGRATAQRDLNRTIQSPQNGTFSFAEIYRARRIFMEKWLERTEKMLGEEAIEFLNRTTVAILGLGGVGGAAAEAICRMGVGRIILIDNDIVDVTNCNRQLLATAHTVGRDKIQVAAERLLSINPNVDLILKKEFYLPENSDFLYNESPDLVLDAIDTVTAKLHLAEKCCEKNIPLVTCLGTGNRLDPSLLRWGDIAQTAGCGCPLACIMRRELKKRNVLKQTVIYSLEEPHKIIVNNGEYGRHSPASCAFVPASAGFLLASVGIRLLLGTSEKSI